MTGVREAGGGNRHARALREAPEAIRHLQAGVARGKVALTL